LCFYQKNARSAAARMSNLQSVLLMTGRRVLLLIDGINREKIKSGYVVLKHGRLDKIFWLKYNKGE